MSGKDRIQMDWWEDEEEAGYGMPDEGGTIREGAG